MLLCYRRFKETGRTTLPALTKDARLRERAFGVLDGVHRDEYFRVRINWKKT